MRTIEKRPLLLLAFFFIVGCQPATTTPEDVTLASGRLERMENFPSKYVLPRNVDVWLPNDYSKEEAYAVLYMHDGQMLFDSTTTWNKQEWGLDETMGQLLAGGNIRNTIIVGIWNTEFRHSEYFPEEPFRSLPAALQDSLIDLDGEQPENALFKMDIASDNYLHFLVDELKPFIDKKYATAPDKDNTIVAGSSMGGLISMYALCEYPEVFGAAGCLSTHWVGTFDTLNNPIPNHFINYLKAHLPDPEEHKLYFDYGTATLDALYEPYQTEVDAVMMDKGYTSTNWITKKFPGENHSENAWRKRLAIPLAFLLNDH